MLIKLATWNINSLRLRMDLVARFIKLHQPDILCLQEIKCHNDDFPMDAVKALGYEHVAVNGQKGYHGVAILSRLPLELDDKKDLDGSGEARHLSVRLPQLSGSQPPLILHNFYVPAGGDKPDIEQNPKFRQKLAYFDLMTSWFSKLAKHDQQRLILLGDLNVAPLETDVWSHKQMLKVVSHTPIEVEKFSQTRAAYQFIDVMREFVPAQEKLFTWWSYRARDWQASNRGRRLDHIWTSPALKEAAKSMQVITETRSWPRPSDHVPVIAEFDL